ncbi:o-succinylbenzoate--CoA ligase [Cytobacillus spongiae]|uniref:o-succinylbenzoate--CoA ligase n=1 Tax=Cytobacillus spongiae TaxID=2901381 RepID=UPI001F1DF381|nr:o-succinylbenzoate--CoA ligase [Cytobacillus spongiae]UII57885.1 o-succinylbenzoate--CoA ligase [Cytobacillus spongiae]
MNVGEWMKSRAYLSGDKEGFVGKNGRYTFIEMNERVNQFANYLQTQGIQQGDRIALLCKNHEDFVTAFFGAAKIGVITVPVNWRLQAKEISYVLNHSAARVVLYDEEFASAIEMGKQEAPAEKYVCSGNGKEDPAFREILASSSHVEPELVSFNEDPILMMYTSGTTGKPKGAVLTHSNLFAASNGLSHTVDWWEQDRFLSVAPFFHIGGFAPLMANVHTGSTTILMEDFDPVLVWKTIEKERITTMMSVPAMLAFLFKTLEQVGADYSTLRNITCGASPVPAQLIQACKTRGISVQQVYGITEYAGAVSFWKEELDPAKFDSMGKAVMHGAFKIVDIHTGEELPPGEDGEILCSGPQVFKGYWQNEEATAKAFENGWYKTGDIGRIDEKGFLYVVDRLKDMIISGGENIYSAEVEAILTAHPEIVEAAVVGVPDQKWGEIPRAIVVKTPDSSLTEEEVIAYCKAELASYKAAKEVVFVPQLPRNAVGKILKTVLKTTDQVPI